MKTSSGRTNVSTLKTATVVILLLAVLYGVYTVLNQPESQPPKEVAAWVDKKGIDLQVDLGAGSNSESSATATPPSIEDRKSMDSEIRLPSRNVPSGESVSAT